MRVAEILVKRRMAWGACLLGLSLLGIGTVLGAPGSLVLSTPEPMRLVAEVETVFPAGAAHAWIVGAQGAFDVRGATGVATVQSWNVTRTPQGEVGDGRVHTARHPLSNATLRFVWRGEEIRTNVLAGEGGEILLRGRVEAAGAATWLEEDVAAQVMFPVDWPLDGRYVPFELRAGDAFVGFHASPTPHVGFPFDRRAVLDLHGPVVLQMDGGSVAFVDDEGGSYEYRLGADPPPGQAPDVARYRRLIFEGNVRGADMPMHDRWIAGGRRVAWLVDGEAEWSRASGTLTTPEGTRRVEDARVLVTGSSRLVPAPGNAVARLDPFRYEGAGDWTSVRIDGAALARGAGLPAAQALGALAFVALLAAALTERGQEISARVFASLYTRLPPGQLLAHPTRARIREIATAEPGILLTDLHRRLGGAWGPFMFHVGMLERMGFISLRKEGRYRAVYVPGSDPAGPRLRGDSSRRVLEALLAHGGNATIPELTQRTGMSRQLVRHHMKVLCAHGLVAQEDARRWVATPLALSAQNVATPKDT